MMRGRDLSHNIFVRSQGMKIGIHPGSWSLMVAGWLRRPSDSRHGFLLTTHRQSFQDQGYHSLSLSLYVCTYIYIVYVHVYVYVYIYVCI